MSFSSGRGDGRNRYGSGRRRGKNLGRANSAPPKDLGLEGSGAAEASRAQGRRTTSDGAGSADTASTDSSAEKTEYDRAKDIVLRQLTMSARSRAQLEEKLRDKEISDQTITEILDKYEDLGLVDDRQFAEMFVRSRSSSRSLARPALRRELAQKGITGDLAEDALAQRTDDDERADAEALVRKKVKAGLDFADRSVREKEMRRLVSMLARRGYSSSMAFDVVSPVIQESSEEIEPPE